MNRRNRFWLGGAAALGAGVLMAGPLVAAAQDDDDWVSDALTGLVSDGTITQEQADAVDQALDAARPTPDAGPASDHGHGGPFGGPRRGGVPGDRLGGPRALDEAATAIGIEPEVLREDLRDGQTIAEVAAENDVETQTVIDAMVAAAKARLDEVVAGGRLDAADVATRLTEATERITTFVNEGLPTRESREAREARPARPDTTDAPHTTTSPSAPPTTTD